MKLPLKILNAKEEEKILKELNSQFGITHLPENSKLLMRGKEKVNLFTGNINESKLKNIEEKTIIENAGFYLGKIEPKLHGFRLSIEGTQLFKNQINKNIVEIPDDKAQEWMMGRELLWEDIINQNKKNPQGFVIIKNKKDFLGCGKSSQEKITNFIPKARRLKEKSII